jgi:hypothetical protein
VTSAAPSASDLARVEARLAELERVLAVGGADRALSFGETCAAIRRAMSTVRRWERSPELRAKFRLDVLLVRDVAGRLTSSPRRLQAWRWAMAARWGAMKVNDAIPIIAPFAPPPIPRRTNPAVASLNAGLEKVDSSIRKLDDSSTKLGRRGVWIAIVVGFLTLIQAGAAVVQLFVSFRAGGR